MIIYYYCSSSGVALLMVVCEFIAPSRTNGRHFNDDSDVASPRFDADSFIDLHKRVCSGHPCGQKMSEFEDTIRIMLASDNHLGYCEKDPIRAKDSFAAFEEILQTAVEMEVDMVLLGGDLFHENKPSRMSVFKAISLLRTYCLGDKPVEIRVVSQQDENFRNKRVNYEDPNFNVGLPVFSINGNHDDPTRESGAEALSACDILSAGNFLNYFGTASRINDINIKPVLIEKGKSKLALYGLGAVRDERLSRMFSKGKVKFVRPKEEVKEYFNMFVLHQNRDTGRGVKNCVHESFLPNFLDLVMWGHEHECKIDPVESYSGYHITQPGSSVATSLVDAESRKKHVAILSILVIGYSEIQFIKKTNKLYS